MTGPDVTKQDIDHGLLVRRSADSTIRVPCNAPAPLVVNGSVFAGCQLDKGHPGNHKFTLQWRTER